MSNAETRNWGWLIPTSMRRYSSGIRFVLMLDIDGKKHGNEREHPATDSHVSLLLFSYSGCIDNTTSTYSDVMPNRNAPHHEYIARLGCKR